MTPYPPDIERTMRAFYRSLRENDRRRYAAVEAAKLGHGGVEYIAKVLGADPKTIRHGQHELGNLPEQPAPGSASRAVVESQSSTAIPRSTTISARSWLGTPPAAPPRSRSSGRT